MKKKLTVLAILLIAFVNLYSQNKWSLRTNAGIASGTQTVDGYYFSFDIGIPLFRSIELSPTFSHASMVPKQSNYYSWDNIYGLSPKSFSTEDSRNEHEFAESLSSISLLVFFKPLVLFYNEKLKKHELAIGTGISYNSYIIMKEAFQLTDNDYELVRLNIQSGKKTEPYYCKFYYNYLFKENLFFGLTAGINGYSGETEILTGLQFGVKF